MIALSNNEWVFRYACHSNLPKAPDKRHDRVGAGCGHVLAFASLNSRWKTPTLVGLDSHDLSDCGLHDTDVAVARVSWICY